MTTTPPTLESLEARIQKLEGSSSDPQPGLSDAIRGLLSSKKALVALGTVISMAAGKLGVHLDDETTAMLASVGVSLILAIGLQDLGKESARIKQQ